MYGGQEGSATKASAYHNLAANTLYHGGCQYRIVTAPKSAATSVYDSHDKINTRYINY